MSDTTIITAHGHAIDLARPVQAQPIVLADIAHHLAQINRFTGAARRPYSVAEHSLLVCEILERLFAGITVHGLLAGLMHDAHEAYCQDVSTPAKHAIGAQWDDFEGRIQRMVRSAFALHAASYDARDAIKAADLIALATEREQLLPASPELPLWPCLVHVQPVRWVDLMSPEREAMTWRDWRQAFTDRHDALDYARNLQMGFAVAS